MPRSQLITSLCLLTAMLVLYAWLLRGYLRKRRLRRQLVADGRLPEGGLGTATKGWGPTLLVVGMAFAARWASDTFVLPRAGGTWANAAFVAALFVIALVVILSRSRVKRDEVVAEALRRAEQGGVDAAAESLRAAMASSPPTPERAGAVGLIFANAGRWAEAAEAYRAARALYPDQPIFTVNLAMALSKCGRAAEALPVLEETRRAAPAEAGLAAAEAIALAALGRADEATEQHRQAKELMEAGAGLQRLDMWTLGAILLESGKSVEATSTSTRGFPVVAATDQPDTATGSGPGGTARPPGPANATETASRTGDADGSMKDTPVGRVSGARHGSP